MIGYILYIIIVILLIAIIYNAFANFCDNRENFFGLEQRDDVSADYIEKSVEQLQKKQEYLLRVR